MSDKNGNNFQNDAMFQLTFCMSIVVYSIVSVTKLSSSNLNLSINKILILSLVSSMIVAISIIIYRTLYFNHVSNDNVALGIIPSIFGIIFVISLITVMNLRNNILIKNKRMLIFTKVLILAIIVTSVLSMIPDTIVIMNNPDSNSAIVTISSEVTYALAISSQVFINIFDIISNIYLLIYYKEYYFNSKSIMRHLQFQMIYRRNWIYFVIFLEIISLIFIITAVLDIYPYTTLAFLILVLLFELNTMIDFVKFDTVRNEVTIGDQTMYLYENDSKAENV